MHLAQLNIGRVRYPTDDPRLADFMNNLDRVNEIAERSPGFVWRLKDDNNNATSFKIDGDPQFIPNLSVWETAEYLEAFVWNTIHKRFYHRRGEWFESSAEEYFVMWNVKEGHRPTLEEALDRLTHLRQHGTSDHAFGWQALPHLTRWLQERCA